MRYKNNQHLVRAFQKTIKKHIIKVNQIQKLNIKNLRLKKIKLFGKKREKWKNTKLIQNN